MRSGQTSGDLRLKRADSDKAPHVAMTSEIVHIQVATSPLLAGQRRLTRVTECIDADAGIRRAVDGLNVQTGSAIPP